VDLKDIAKATAVLDAEQNTQNTQNSHNSAIKGQAESSQEESLGMEVVENQEVNGRRGGTRTPGPRIRNPLLYPPELHARKQVQLDNIDGFGSSQMAGRFGIVRI
jgi:hypothetical protein